MTRGLLVWLLIMLVETIHGVLRALLLVPRIGETAAARLGWPVGALLVVVIAFLSLRWMRLTAPRQLLLLGAAWAVLTLLLELAIGLLRGFPPQAFVAALNPLTGTIFWSAAVMFLAPVAAARLRRLR